MNETWALLSILHFFIKNMFFLSIVTLIMAIFYGLHTYMAINVVVLSILFALFDVFVRGKRVE